MKFNKTLTTLSTLMLALSFSASTLVSAEDTSPKTSTANTTLTFDDTGGDSQITLDTVPYFDFGTQMITGKPITVADIVGDPLLQVTNRGGAAGWGVTVAISEFADVTTPTTKLVGPVLTFTAATPADNSGGGANTAVAATGVINDAAKSVFYAPAGAGIGINTDEITAKLEIPANNVAGEYKAELTWTLTDVPNPLPQP
ncbi:WxL domain-containing protein [Lapidilactobacillus achengensis]|uniref:WxL domain-containing protein n=1 Tax=Lapidilactobacillus achengensis TaxID=2486000 RepID=A0ABW1UQW3_9LACO|nr:WxL domain-containing protein [Lapidilactobacillus achengensis]